MVDDKPRRTLLHPTVLWCVVATVALITAIQLGRAFGLRSSIDDPWRDASFVALLLGWLVTLAVAVLATWRLVRLGAYTGLLVLGAVVLLLVEPGRAGEAATWRIEWGVFGVLWTAAAIGVFAWLLTRQDELARRIHCEGAALGLAIAVSAATVYALFEQVLPPLAAQHVAVALLVAWLCGRLIVSWRYR
jgi:hypothetical protein